MAKLSKKQKALAEKVDAEKLYGVDEALALLKEVASKKFDETVEVAMNLGVDPRHADQMVRGMVSLPAGTGKDFCRALGVQTLEKALHAIDADVTATIDVGRISYVDQRSGETATRYFVNCADAGLGAEAAAKINASSKRFGAVATYATGAVRAIAAFEFRDATYTVDGTEVFSGRSGMAVFANGPTFAGGMQIAPGASLWTRSSAPARCRDHASARGHR